MLTFGKNHLKKLKKVIPQQKEQLRDIAENLAKANNEYKDAKKL